MTATHAAAATAVASAGPAAAAHRHSPSSADEHRALLVELEDTRRWPAAAAALLADLGFRLIADGPTGEASHLLVAIRDRPTLAHFDPEDVAYFAITGARGSLVRIDRRSIDEPGESFEKQALWGHVHVIDRVPVENRFLTFGGTLRAAVVDSELAVLDLWSPAPIVRWGGHSQSVDPLTDAIGAFFGRLIIPIDFMPGAEARINALPPDVLYRAFLLDWMHRIQRAERRGFEATPLSRWVAAAWRRARLDEAACRAAEMLLEELPGG
jgi:hypothetical protein